MGEGGDCLFSVIQASSANRIWKPLWSPWVWVRDQAGFTWGLSDSLRAVVLMGVRKPSKKPHILCQPARQAEKRSQWGVLDKAFKWLYLFFPWLVWYLISSPRLSEAAGKTVLRMLEAVSGFVTWDISFFVRRTLDKVNLTLLLWRPEQRFEFYPQSGSGTVWGLGGCG